MNCHYHPQPSGHYAKSTFYVNTPTPVALTGAVVPTPVSYRPPIRADEVYESGSYAPQNHLHANLVVGEENSGSDGGHYDEVDHEVMRVKLPPAPVSHTVVDTR